MWTVDKLTSLSLLLGMLCRTSFLVLLEKKYTNTRQINNENQVFALYSGGNRLPSQHFLNIFPVQLFT